MFVRPARSSSFDEVFEHPEEVAPDDSEEDWLDAQQQAELSRSEPQDACPTGPVRAYREKLMAGTEQFPRAWQQVWTAEQIADLDDLASYLDYIWEVDDVDFE